MVSLTNRTIIAIVLIMLMLALSAAYAASSEAPTANDTARFFAGLPPSTSSPLVALTKDPAWLSHARYFDSVFVNEESAHLSKVRQFSKEYLTDKQDTMLYMFSGPDFLYATSFFPNASTYVLAGLEPVGVIPDLTRLSPWVINGELRNLEISMGSLFNYSFFITQNMKTQLREGRYMARCRSYMSFWHVPERPFANSISSVWTSRETFRQLRMRWPQATSYLAGPLQA